MAVKSLRSRVLCIHLTVLNKQLSERLYLKNILTIVHTVTLGHDDYQAFNYQLDQWGVENVFHNHDESITRELKMYIKEWEKMNIKNKSQVSKTIFLAKYGSLAIYDEDLEKRFIIAHEQL